MKKLRLASIITCLVLATSAYAAPALAQSPDNVGAETAKLALTASVQQEDSKSVNPAAEKLVSQALAKKISLAKAKASVSAQQYTGKQIKPKIKVTLGKTTLRQGKDYKVAFSRNIEPGTATATISGIKGYTGKLTAKFKIKTTKGLKKVGNKAFFFKDAKGTKAKGWVKSGSKWYWADSKGRLAKGWKKISGTWYYLDPSTYAMKTGWQKIGGSWYYLDSGGAMKTGWQKIGSSWYYLNSNGVMAASQWVGDYYLQSDGSMATSKWIGNYWVDSSGRWTETWSESSNSNTVYITRTGAKFHAAGCRWLYASKIPISRSDAISRGYEPCSICNP